MIKVTKLTGDKKGLLVERAFKLGDLTGIIKRPALDNLVNVSPKAGRILGLRKKQLQLRKVLDKMISYKLQNKNGPTTKPDGIVYARTVSQGEDASRINVDFIIRPFSLSTRILALLKWMPITENMHYVFSSCNSAGEQVGKDGKVLFNLDLLPRNHKR